MASGANRNFIGFYRGTGSGGLKVEAAGFEPRYIKVTNLSDGSSVEYWAPMEDIGSASAGGKKVTALGAASFLTAAAGLTVTSGGFEVGTDAACNDSGVQYAYECSD